MNLWTKKHVVAYLWMVIGMICAVVLDIKYEIPEEISNLLMVLLAAPPFGWLLYLVTEPGDPKSKSQNVRVGYSNVMISRRSIFYFYTLILAGWIIMTLIELIIN